MARFRDAVLEHSFPISFRTKEALVELISLKTDCNMSYAICSCPEDTNVKKSKFCERTKRKTN